jgi:hypothetical protein
VFAKARVRIVQQGPTRDHAERLRYRRSKSLTFAGRNKNGGDGQLTSRRHC